MEIKFIIIKKKIRNLPTIGTIISGLEQINGNLGQQFTVMFSTGLIVLHSKTI